MPQQKLNTKNILPPQVTPHIQVKSPEKGRQILIPIEETQPQTQVFNNPLMINNEYDGSPGKYSQSSNRDDEMMDWSEASLTPSNKLSSQ